MKRSWIIIIFIVNLLFNINAVDDIFDYKTEQDKFSNYNWGKPEKNTVKYYQGKGLLERINLVFENIKKNQLNNEDMVIKKIKDGLYKINETEFITIDYNEVFEDTIDSFFYNDTAKKIKMLYRGDYLYIVDYRDKIDTYYKIKICGLLFNESDFVYGVHSLEKLTRAIESDLYAESVIPKEEIYALYDKNETGWKKYFYNPDDNLILFRKGIDYNLKNELVNPIIGKSYPSRLLPVYSKYTRDFGSSKRSVNFLNELISVPNFYYVWLNRNNYWLGKELKLSSELSKKVGANIKIINKLLSGFEKKNINNLSFTTLSESNSIDRQISEEERRDIMIMNRMILEDTYKELVPPLLELDYISEDIFGDIDNTITESNIELLLDYNLTNSIILETNQDMAFVNTGNETIDQRNFRERIIKSIADSEIIILPTTPGDPKYDQNKNRIVPISNDKSRFDYFKKFKNIRRKLDVILYYTVLKNYFENGISSKSLEIIYDKEYSIWSELSNYSSMKIAVKNKMYDIKNYKDISQLALELRYYYLKKNLQEILKNNTEWEIPLTIIKLDDGLYTTNFMEYENE